MNNINESEPANNSMVENQMVPISAGYFSMGSNDGGPFEAPQHKVWVDTFLMDPYPVTNVQFADFIAATGYRTVAERNKGAYGFRDGAYREFIHGLNWRTYYLADRAHHPVVLVSWHDAKAYADWAGKRLPTEAEWEKAARGGRENELYAWGNGEPNGTQSNFAKTPQDLPPTTPVDHFPPNGLGLYDMVGNVWQWCQDWFQEDVYTQHTRQNPQGPAEGQLKVRRGGSWNVIQSFRLRSANRGALPPETVVPNIGFRCAKDMSL
ncbi:MAG: formylglycine-generating enzyme family protein [Bacteroidota bacterium]